MILRVAIPTPLHRLFDYRPPLSGTLKPQVGCRVSVPFGQRKVIGIITALPEHSELPLDKLKPAHIILDAAPVLDGLQFYLARWAASYYAYPEGDALSQALPALLRKGEPAEFTHETLWRATPGASLDALSKSATRQRELLALLLRNPKGVSTDLLRVESLPVPLLKTLKDKALAETFIHHPTPLHADEREEGEILKEAPLTLNTEQHQALQNIAAGSGFNTLLLEGITGSGKTEVYLQAIQQVLKEGKQALILVPEIGLTPQTLARFKARFQVPVIALHSGLTDRQRLDAWLMAREGSARILIGTRSAIFTPMRYPGLIIVDEEHDQSFKQQDGFRYSARDLAVLRAKHEDIALVLGSATPSLESLHNALSGRYRHSLLTTRAGKAMPPAFELLDIRGETLNCGLSDSLTQRIETHLAQGTQILIFLNRRGFSPSLICHNCGAVNECTRCDARMTLHRSPPHMHCHHCDRQTPIPMRCNQCGSEDLRPSGAGTERTEDFLCHRFPKTPVLRIDRDSTARKNAMSQLMAQIHTGKPCIMIGTQMLAKGHHFPRVTLVAVLDADSGLFSADFRGMEKTAQLVLQVAGRAGRADHPGEVVMQTRHPDHPMLNALIRDGYGAFAASELQMRKAAGLPPFSFHALIRAEATRQGWAEGFLRDIREMMEEQLAAPSGSHWSGPFPSPMEKRAGLYRAQLLIQSRQRSDLHQLLMRILTFLIQHKARNKVRWSIDVDPLDSY
ncbi:primosomal protein N' [Nitrincola iocasae]|uniref:Replication restart protein PriA n=1 Tax=Nitrincola iocasae TaxID=2614693 RepID=A0A5J6LI26_9GAMM|nr:primosomal protein N' [Nitrincola iocasae]QEW07946.1 primosomal protein N' [Nitrincola iocasae]